MALPYIDERIIYRGVSYLRKLNETKLKELDKAIVLQDRNYDPIVVIFPMKMYNNMKRIIDEMKEEEDAN